MADLVSSYENLKHLKDRNAGEVNGYLASSGYPQDFQTMDFPKLAGQGGKVTTLAHYQAFFFTARKDPQKPNDAENQKLDTGKLKELFENIYDNKTHFTMLMDADALRTEMSPEAFGKKLGDAGDDAAQVKSQVTIIRDFVNNGGIRTVAEEVIREKNLDVYDPIEIQRRTDAFLNDNFKLQGVETPEPLKAAVWQVEAKTPDGKENGYLAARQNYYKNKQWDGSWQIGTGPELDNLVRQPGGHQGARQILDAVGEMNRMQTIDLTNGYKKIASQEPIKDTSPAWHADLLAVKGSLKEAGFEAAGSDEKPGKVLMGVKVQIPDSPVPPRNG